MPEEHLRHLYELVLLMARPFKCLSSSPAPEKLSPAHLQAYADKFREGFSLIMKKSVGLNFSFQIQEKFTILKVSFPDIEMQKDTIEEAVFDLEQIC
ncbi:MAG: hypothetical protein HC913_06755 [Microscillaceae bacterium]|nr:hypothetical protein [Microscillaceae bacterium]